MSGSEFININAARAAAHREEMLANANSWRVAREAKRRRQKRRERSTAPAETIELLEAPKYSR